MRQVLGGRRIMAGVAVAALAAVGIIGGHRPAGSETGTPRASSSQGAPILVELFTSQGCSSCPPADRFLTELAAREDLEIIPLSFHVDYWNYIGWTDPFSSAAWSDRQRRYARSLRGGRVYTPQMVVNGRWAGVGSDRREITRLLERASAEPRTAEMSVEAELVSDDRLRVVVRVSRIDFVLRLSRLTIWVALVESGLTTAVGRGENASKTLRNDRVVRRLERVSGLGSLRPGASGSLDFVIEDGWRRDKLSVVAFLQEDDSLRVRAAAESVPAL